MGSSSSSSSITSTYMLRVTMKIKVQSRSDPMSASKRDSESRGGNSNRAAT